MRWKDILKERRSSRLEAQRRAFNMLLIESEQGRGVSVLSDRALQLGFFHWRFYFARRKVFSLCVIVSQHVQLCSNGALVIGEGVDAVWLCGCVS